MNIRGREVGALFGVEYSSYSDEEVDAVTRGYGFGGEEYFGGNCKSTRSQTVTPSVQKVFHKDYGAAAGFCRTVLRLSMGGNVSTEYGSPATMFLDVTAYPQRLASAAEGPSKEGLVANVTLTIIDKPTTRTTESASIRFAPSAQIVDPSSLELHKVSSWIGPTTVAENGSKHIHCKNDPQIAFRPTLHSTHKSVHYIRIIIDI